MMVSFVLSFFPRDVLDEILNLIESVSEDFPSYSSSEEKSVINHHIFQNATRFGVSVDEDQERLPTFYWLPTLHKQPYKSRFIANSRSCTTTKLFKLLTSCLITIKHHVIKYCEKVYERFGKNLFWSIKNSCEVINKLKSRSFFVRPVCLHMIFLHYILPSPTILLRIY